MHEVGSEDGRWRVNYEVAQAPLRAGHQVVLVASEAASEPKSPLIHKLTFADAPPGELSFSEAQESHPPLMPRVLYGPSGGSRSPAAIMRGARRSGSASVRSMHHKH
jgi:hypothetical protein